MLSASIPDRIESLQPICSITDQVDHCLSFIENAEELQTLKLINCSLVSIDLTSFKQFSNLKVLDVSHNVLHDLQGIDSFQYLQCLIASNNSLEPTNILCKLQDLQVLDLESNDINDTHFLEQLNSLIYLNIRCNPIGEHFSCFSESSLIEELYLDNCQISTFSIPQLPHLRRLSLSGNKLESLSLPSLPKLEALSVSSNKISSFSINSDSLLFLDISDNPISETGITSKSSSLQVLFASQTKIERPISLVSSFPQLRTLDISKTRLIRLEDLDEFLIAAQHIEELDTRATPLTMNLYPSNFKPESSSIIDFDQAYPSHDDERRSYRLQVLKTTTHQISMLDNIPVTCDEYVRPSHLEPENTLEKVDQFLANTLQDVVGCTQTEILEPEMASAQVQVEISDNVFEKEKKRKEQARKKKALLLEKERLLLEIKRLESLPINSPPFKRKRLDDSDRSPTVTGRTSSSKSHKDISSLVEDVYASTLSEGEITKEGHGESANKKPSIEHEKERSDSPKIEKKQNPPKKVDIQTSTRADCKKCKKKEDAKREKQAPNGETIAKQSSTKEKPSDSKKKEDAKREKIAKQSSTKEKPSDSKKKEDAKREKRHSDGQKRKHSKRHHSVYPHILRLLENLLQENEELKKKRRHHRKMPTYDLTKEDVSTEIFSFFRTSGPAPQEIDMRSPIASSIQLFLHSEYNASAVSIKKICSSQRFVDFASSFESLNLYAEDNIETFMFPFRKLLKRGTISEKVIQIDAVDEGIRGPLKFKREIKRSELENAQKSGFQSVEYSIDENQYAIVLDEKRIIQLFEITLE